MSPATPARGAPGWCWRQPRERSDSTSRTTASGSRPTTAARPAPVSPASPSGYGRSTARSRSPPSGEPASTSACPWRPTSWTRWRGRSGGGSLPRRRNRLRSSTPDGGAHLTSTPARGSEESGARRTVRTRPLVLVVEDHPGMSSLLVDMLAPDYEVATAVNGREGLEKARNLNPDLVLTDVMMPEMGGDELVRALRADDQLASTPILVLTAKLDQDLRVQLLRQGAQDYVLKPFSVEELRARVGNVVTTKRARD